MPQLFDPWVVGPFVADMNACRALLRSGSKSFDLAAKLLPRAVRDPAVALYAFCREADDAIDEGSGGLSWLRERLTLVYEGRPLTLPTDRALAHVVARFAIPRALPEALLEGFAWDIDGRRYQDLSELRAYAARVAGSVGAMMAVVMGARDSERLAAAVELGVAMQLSNIARDVGEDARNGRIYLPLGWLAEAGIDPEAFLAKPRHSPAAGARGGPVAGSRGATLPPGERRHRQAADRLPLRHWHRGAALRRDRTGGRPAQYGRRVRACRGARGSQGWRADDRTRRHDAATPTNVRKLRAGGRVSRRRSRFDCASTGLDPRAGAVVGHGRTPAIDPRVV